MEEEDRAESAVSSCVSMKSNRSKHQPPDLRDEDEPPNPNGVEEPLISHGWHRRQTHLRALFNLPSPCRLLDLRTFTKDTKAVLLDCRNLRSPILHIHRSSRRHGDLEQAGKIAWSQQNPCLAFTPLMISEILYQVNELQEVLEGHKISLKRRCEHVTEGTNEAGSGTLLSKIYTELYITEGQSEEVNTQHEVR
ncbi:hypothetical protein D4764_0274440, partial [Takifugu flavidus]